MWCFGASLLEFGCNEVQERLELFACQLTGRYILVMVSPLLRKPWKRKVAHVVVEKSK